MRPFTPLPWVFIFCLLTAPAWAEETQVTNHPGGGRTVVVTGRNVEPANMSTTYNADGQITAQDGEYTDGSQSTSSYDPATGVRTSTRVGPKGETTSSVSQADGSSVITQTGFNENTTVTEEDAGGHVTTTTTRPDGTKSVESFTRVDDPGGYTQGPPVTTTTTEYDADGKPTSTVAITTERWGNSYRQTRREVTEYDERGKPTKTTATAPRGTYGGHIKVEEVEYWGNGFRKVIKRFDANGEMTEVYYYDHLGHLERSSIKPGHTAGEAPTSGDWHKPAGGETSRAPEPAPREDAFADDVGTTTPGLDGFGAALGRELSMGPEPQQQHDNYRQ